MLAHNVYFTLADGSRGAVDALVAACEKYLEPHPGVVFFACGRVCPDLAREVNDRDFHVALHIFFDSRAAHDAYQAHDLHKKFIAEMKPNWSRVRVFDSDC